VTLLIHFFTGSTGVGVLGVSRITGVGSSGFAGVGGAFGL
jgi:hypothetical protein